MTKETVSIEEIISKVEDFVSDPATWHKNEDYCKEELREMIRSYVQQNINDLKQ